MGRRSFALNTFLLAPSESFESAARVVSYMHVHAWKLFFHTIQLSHLGDSHISQEKIGAKKNPKLFVNTCIVESFKYLQRLENR